ncbi:MAG: hypothetical protein LBK67_07135 [Coriobacteriales bacterium]|jgi:hypothetical protein|nr:hypothetical protein [Coriobacteriales bacterium]
MPDRTIDDWERDDYDIASIEVIEKTEDGILFEISANPSNFQAFAAIMVGDDVITGTKGVVAGRDRLAFDGSYEYKYDFLFPRKGNLFQKILTAFGVWNFNPSYEGHVEGRVSAEFEGDYVDYTNEEFGFTAQFPVMPEESMQTIDDDSGFSIPITTFGGGIGPVFNYVECLVLPVEQLEEATGGPYEAYINENMENIMRAQLLDSLYLVSGETDLGPEIVFKDRQGYPSASTIVFAADSSGYINWLYATVVYRDGVFYTAAGVRESKEAAIVAEASFRLL